jgi:hypothetical protein
MRTLPKRTKHFFDKFANNANKQLPHPSDMKRFYRFIHACHQGKTKSLASEVERLLIHAGFDKEYAKELAGIYCLRN